MKILVDPCGKRCIGSRRTDLQVVEGSEGIERDGIHEWCPGPCLHGTMRYMEEALVVGVVEENKGEGTLESGRECVCQRCHVRSGTRLFLYR